MGRYDFIFGRAEDTGDAEQVRVRLLIEPPTVEGHQATALMVLDTPVFGEVVQPFVVAGWAIDLAAWSGTGVDAVHVWAYPTPGSGATPIFLGVADPGGRAAGGGRRLRGSIWAERLRADGVWPGPGGV